MLPVVHTQTRRRPGERLGVRLGVGPRRANLFQKPLTSCAFLLVAFALIYICCVLVSFFRSHGNHPQAPGSNSLEVRRSGKVRTADPDANRLQTDQQVPTPPVTQSPTLLQRLQAPLKTKENDRRPQPDRVRAHDLEYEICPASAYSRGESTACATYLYAAPFARTTPLLPVLPALSDPRPPPPLAWQPPTPHTPPDLPYDEAPEEPPTDTPTVAKTSIGIVEKRPDPSVLHHFKDPVLSPGQLGRHAPKPPPTPELTTPEDTQEDDLHQLDISSDTTYSGTVQDEDNSTEDNSTEEVEEDPEEQPDEDDDEEEDSNEDPPVEGDTQGATEASIEDSDSVDTTPEEESTTTDVDSQRRLLEESTPQDPISLSRPTRIAINSTAQSRAAQTSQLLSDSDEATGVLAAAIMLAAEEQQKADANLVMFPTLHTPPATASLPEDIRRWSHIQLDRAIKIQAAWRSGNTSAVSFPHALALLNHPSRAALARSFASASSCVLQRLGGPAAASPAAHVTPEEAPNSVVSWPQYLSYESAESMPTGRETSMPGALMRGVFVAHANGSVILDLYDPRAPLDSEEVQDSLPELYRIELRSGDLVLLPPWILTSILAVPPLSRGKIGPREPPTMHQYVKRAFERSRYLGFDSSMNLEDFPHPPHATHAAILHLALPGDPSLSAGSILPMHMGPLPPPSLSQQQHALRRRLLVFDDSENEITDADEDEPDVGDDEDSGQDEDSQEDEPLDTQNEDAGSLLLTDDDEPDSDATVDDDDLAGVDVVQEHNTNSTHADTDDTGTEDDSQDDDGQEDDDEDDPDNDAGDTEWSDQERRLQQPAYEGPVVPLHRPSKPVSLNSPGKTLSSGLHAPGGRHVHVAADTMHAPGDISKSQSIQDSTVELQAPGEKRPGAVPGDTGAKTGGGTGDAQEHEDMCMDVDRIWFAFGSPLTVYSLPKVDPQLNLHALRTLALTAFKAFKSCLPNKGEEFDRESPGSLGDELFEWQSNWPEPGSIPCDGGQPGPIGQRMEKEWRAAYSAYLDSEEHAHMLRAVSTTVVSMLKRMGKDDLAEDQDPGIFSWLTVHDESMSYHGRHYHRNQALTAVLYLEVPHESAPLEFSNPIEGPDSQPNGRAVFVPTIGDFVLFPSYLPHTVPMRLLRDKQQPRISIAFNIWLAGPGLDRFAEGVSEEERDNVGKHQYFAVSDVTMDRHFTPREGLDLSIERDDDIH